MSAMTDHLDDMGETYFEHLGEAAGFAAAMFLGAVVCLVHAVLPFAFTHAGSDRIQTLHEAMTARRRRVDESEDTDLGRTTG